MLQHGKALETAPLLMTEELHFTLHYITFLLNGFPFLVLIFSFYFGSCGKLSWLNCQLSSAR